MFDTALYDRYVFDDGLPMATMTTANFTVCSGGGHIHFNVSTDGGPAIACRMGEDETMTPLTSDEQILHTRLSIRLFATGKTWTQTKSLIQSGLTIKV